ncbi:MAG: SDR family oxidoreductase [Trueperaceae bacterium]|nr:SDR family oxidoreductase [Trueperaceae bacterium]
MSGGAATASAGSPPVSDEPAASGSSTAAFGRFDLTGRVALVTGATGVLGGEMARGLAAHGAKVAVLGRNAERAEELAAGLASEGYEALATPADVLDRPSLERAREAIMKRFGRLDVLVNAAGGNMPGATLLPGASFLELGEEPMREVIDLNYMGTVLPIQVFGAELAKGGHGSIVNISSMAALRAITRVVGYSAAKAAIDNLTRWLAMEFGRQYGGGLRVNAMAPGFFIGNQNRRLLLEEDGSLTARGRTIIDHTPLGRFGEPEELVGTLVWLCSDASRFVTGVVVPVDGGFAVTSGV